MIEEKKRENDNKVVKNAKIAELTIWIIVLVVLFVAILHFTQNGMSGFIFVNRSSNVMGKLVEVKNEIMEMAGIKEVELELHDADLEVYLVDTNTIQVIELSNDEEKNDLFEMRQHGDTIQVKRDVTHNGFIHLGNQYSHRIEVYLPVTYKEKLEVKNTSGEININEDIEFHELELATTSGDISLKNVKAETAISTTSGKIKIEKVIGEWVAIATTSGDISIQEGEGDFAIATTSGAMDIGSIIGEKHGFACTSGDIMITQVEGECSVGTSSGRVYLKNLLGSHNNEIKTTSGDVTIDQMEGAGEISTSSGAVTIGEVLLSDDLEIDTTSGDVSIEVNQSVGAEIEIDTNSGDIRGNADIEVEEKHEHHAEGQVGTSKEYKISIETSSGNIKIDEK